MDWADFLAPICGTVLGCAGIIWGVVGIFGGLSKWSHESEYMAGIIRAKWFSVITLIVFPVYLYGIFNKKSLLMLPALIWYLAYVTIVSYIIAGFIFLVMISKGPEEHNRFEDEEISFVFILFLIMAILWFFFVVSFWLFIRIRNSKNAPRQDIAYQVGSQSDPDQNGVQINNV